MELYTKADQTLLGSGGIIYSILMETNAIEENEDVLRRILAAQP